MVRRPLLHAQFSQLGLLSAKDFSISSDQCSAFSTFDKEDATGTPFLPLIAQVLSTEIDLCLFVHVLYQERLRLQIFLAWQPGNQSKKSEPTILRFFRDE